ncbi:MAG: RidA family protein [Azospirillaceae bacterium]
MTDKTPLVPVAAPGSAPATGSYAPALVGGGLIFVSGQGPIDETGAIVAGTIEEETTRTLANVLVLVRAAGGDLDRIARCTCYLADIAEFDRFDAAYRAFFGDHKPTRTTVQAGLDGIRVEIDAIALA